MLLTLLLLTLGAASTFARLIKVTDAEALEFLHLLDADGDGAATLQEITDKANQLDAELGSLAGLPSVSSIVPTYVNVSFSVGYCVQDEEAPIKNALQDDNSVWYQPPVDLDLVCAVILPGQ